MKTAKIFKTDSNWYLARLYDSDYINDLSISVHGDGHYCSISDSNLKDIMIEVKQDVLESNIFIV